MDKMEEGIFRRDLCPKLEYYHTPVKDILEIPKMKKEILKEIYLNPGYLDMKLVREVEKLLKNGYEHHHICRSISASSGRGRVDYIFLLISYIDNYEKYESGLLVDCILYAYCKLYDKKLFEQIDVIKDVNEETKGEYSI